MRDAFSWAHKVSSGAEIQRRIVGPQHEVTAHASGQVDDQLVIFGADPFENLAEKRRVAARGARHRIANMQVHDGCTGGMRIER